MSKRSSCGACNTGCSCGSGCGCNGCSCCKRNADFGEVSMATTETVIIGVNGGAEVFEAQVESGGCGQCGSNCTCNPCNCK
uniref:Metallothionein-like protein n=1 Tax=Allium sativum TaxID=4682 RepID=Q52NY6_ALLSA|nr:type 2 metallothionein [Allium sativum]